MNHILEKSRHNHLAVEMLKDKELFAPSVHCGYYSCIQKVMYILSEHFTDEYEKGIAAMEGRKKGNLHSFCIKEFCGRSQKYIDRDDLRMLSRKLQELRTYRIEADYKDIEITESKANQAQEYTDYIHRLIKSVYKE